jgi:4-hydroxybenzoate polyprenyltransferase
VTRLQALRVLHPFPSAVNALLVGLLFLLAGGDGSGATRLAVAMLGLQFCIGATNDLADADADAGRKPGKPIPQGLISRRWTAVVSVLCGAVGLLLYASFGVTAVLFGVAMLGVGLAYDLRLKHAGLGWACFAVAFPLLPLSTWWIAAGALPPRAGLLLTVAAIAGPALSLSNSMVDLERDAAVGVPTLAVRLGRGRALAVLAVLLAVTYGSALLSLAAEAGPAAAPGLVLAATTLAVLGLALSAEPTPARRERGWQAQVIGLALLTLGWVASVA